MISPRMMLVGGALLVCAVTAGLLLAWRPDPGPGALPPPVTIPALPPPSDAPSPWSTRAATATVPRPAPPATTTTRPAAPARSTPSSTPSAPPPSSAPAPALTPGATISLAPTGNPAARIHHRDFRARLGPPARTDRSTATFTVRRSAAAPGCLSLETVPPGRLLRHRDFELHVDPPDGSPLFTQDSAFCPEQRGGGALVLRSVNYPDRFVGRDGDLLALTPAPVEFLVRPPL